MSLDQNLFTLTFTPNADDPSVTDLVDGSGVLHYHKQRVPGGEYKMNVYDPISTALLASATAPSATSKVKTLELYNPSSVVELKYTGTLTFRWSFSWEGHDFEWKREECYIIRKPDPPVLIAVTKEPPGRIKTSTVQMLDYNINRFDIDDRKGFEIVVLTALLTFQDSSDDVHSPTATPSSENPVSTPTSSLPNPLKMLTRGTSAIATAPAPVPPPKPAPREGAERVRELHALRRDAINEVTVEEEVEMDGWAEYCVKLLQDDAMLFITIRSAGAEQVPKVLQVVEETKRKRYKSGVDEEQQLHQYVVYDTPTQRKGPRVIKLDDPSSKRDNYAPPQSLSVHLSKIPMPELQPNIAVRQPTQRAVPRRVSDPVASPSGSGSTLSRPLSTFLSMPGGKNREKDDGKKVKDEKKKESPKDDRKKLQKPGKGQSPPSTATHSRVPSSSQPPPVPSSSRPPPPMPNSGRPVGPQGPWASPPGPAFPMPQVHHQPMYAPPARPRPSGPPAPRPMTMFTPSPGGTPPPLPQQAENRTKLADRLFGKINPF